MAIQRDALQMHNLNVNVIGSLLNPPDDYVYNKLITKQYLDDNFWSLTTSGSYQPAQCVAKEDIITKTALVLDFSEIGIIHDNKFFLCNNAQQRLHSIPQVYLPIRQDGRIIIEYDLDEGILVNINSASIGGNIQGTTYVKPTSEGLILPCALWGKNRMDEYNYYCSFRLTDSFQIVDVTDEKESGTVTPPTITYPYIEEYTIQLTLEVAGSRLNRYTSEDYSISPGTCTNGEVMVYSSYQNGTLPSLWLKSTTEDKYACSVSVKTKCTYNAYGASFKIKFECATFSTEVSATAGSTITLD